MRKRSSLAGTVTAGLLLASQIAVAQEPPQPSVKELLNRAQTQSDRRAVDDLINRLSNSQSTTPAPSPPPVVSPQPPAAAPAAPPAGKRSERGPAASGAIAAPVLLQPPGVAGAIRDETATGGPAGKPPSAAQGPAVRRGAAFRGAAPRQPAEAAPAPFATDAEMAAAPEMAEKMKLPTADIEVRFDFDSAAVTVEAMDMLDMLGEALADPRLAEQRFVIAGHTDGQGRVDYNLALSQRRADAVRQYVVEKYQIDPANLISRGFGK